MNQYNNSKSKLIHFSKWANKSYAVFGSIGKVIRIGFVTSIIKQIASCKSALLLKKFLFFHENGLGQIEQEGEQTGEGQTILELLSLQYVLLGTLEAAVAIPAKRKIFINKIDMARQGYFYLPQSQSMDFGAFFITKLII